jgi:hypothetical protein
MAEDEKLRSLIRFIPAARALRDQLEKSIHLEIYAGTGDTAVKSLHGLQASIAEISKDSYVANLSVEVKKDATDKEKVSLALLVATQLCSYLEGQTGLIGLGGQKSAQYAPNININNIRGLNPEQLNKLVDMATDGLHPGKKEEKDGP